jgi:hypothetical protein
VVLLDLEREGMEGDVESLNNYSLANESPRLWVLSSATAEQNRAFFWKYGPAFEVREAPPSLLRPLYRTLPRSFLVWDGKVSETWSGLPPTVLAADAKKRPGSVLTDRVPPPPKRGRGQAPPLQPGMGQASGEDR